jgi:hypothetical protein
MNDRFPAEHGQQGFALVLAILSLMLLTFLGLTMATTTSTELQIATNYRWSQQALYNAEAGLEAARIVLSNEADVVDGWLARLPLERTALPWPEGSAPGPEAGDLPGTGRDFYQMGCDERGGIGYGKILEDASTRYEDVSTFEGETLNGVFTVWIRRGLETTDQGTFHDSDRNDALIIVSEGRAPYTGAGTHFTRTRQATRVLETTFSLGLSTVGDPCLGSQSGQEGMSPTGENFNPCAPITAGDTGSLANAFGGAGAGDLETTGAR